jgi:hypothetical protein
MVWFTYHEYEMHVGTGVTAGQDESRVAGLGTPPLFLYSIWTLVNVGCRKLPKIVGHWKQNCPLFSAPLAIPMIVCHITEEL